MIRDKKGPKITWSEGFEREECVWEVKRLKTIERDRGEVRKNRTKALYRNFINLDRLRCVERCQDLKRMF